MTTDSSTGAVACVRKGALARAGCGIEEFLYPVDTFHPDEDELIYGQQAIDALRAEVERLQLLAGNQHEMMQAHGVPLPDGYALPEAASAFIAEYVQRRERAERAEADLAESRHDYEIQSQYVEALKVRVAGLSRDAERLDWLADPKNKIGNVQLPLECVANNLHSLRAAIDAAMAGEVG